MSRPAPLALCLFVLTGLLPWTFFATALTGGGNSVVGSERLITKIYFPRLMIPIAAVFAGWIDLAISLVLLLAFTRYYGIVWTWRMANCQEMCGAAHPDLQPVAERK